MGKGMVGAAPGWMTGKGTVCEAPGFMAREEIVGASSARAAAKETVGIPACRRDRAAIPAFGWYGFPAGGLARTGQSCTVLQLQRIAVHLAGRSRTWPIP